MIHYTPAMASSGEVMTGQAGLVTKCVVSWHGREYQMCGGPANKARTGTMALGTLLMYTGCKQNNIKNIL